MTTAQDLVNQTRQRLQGSVGARLDFLADDINTSVTTLTLEDSATGLRPGTVIELDEELMYVRQADEGTGELTVLRAHNGTTAAAHTAGDLVRIAPSYTTQDLFQAVKDEFAALNGTGLVQYFKKEFSWSRTVRMVDSDLPTTVDHLFVQEAHYEIGGSYSNDRPINVELRNGMDVADFPSGSAFHVYGLPGGSLTSTPTIRVVAATTFGTLSALDDVVDDGTLGTDDTIIPIVVIGAAWRLLLGKEAQRLNPDHSHGSRRAEEIDPGAIAFLGRAFKSQRDDLIEQALQRQQALYPPRMEVQ